MIGRKLLGSGWQHWIGAVWAKAHDLLTRRSWPIRLHLALFALALLAPLLFFSAVVTGHFIRTEHRGNERQLQAMARSIAADVDREIAGMISTLKALSNSPSLQNGDLAAFYAQAKLTLAPTNRNAVLMDMAGKQLINTRMPWGTMLPITERNGSAFPRTVAQSREPHVSDLFVGTVSRDALISISVPVFRGDEVSYVLVMSLEPQQLVPVFRQAQLPEGWDAGISDRNNRILARSRLHGQFIGKPVSTGAQVAAGAREGVLQTTDLEGRPSLHAFYWSDLSGWRTAVWVPVAVIEAPLNEFQRWLIALGGTSLMLATLLAVYFGQRLSKPIAAAAEAGRLLGQGKALKPLASPLSEVNEVVDALRAASVEIRQRTRELSNSETRLKVAQSLAGLATFDWNLRTDQVVCSENFRSLFGLPEANPINPNTMLDVVHPDDRKRVAADIQRVRTSGGVYDVEFRVQTPAGSTRWIAGTGEALLDHDEVPYRILGANYDVTDFKRAAETNAQLAAVVQSSLDAVMSLAVDGTIRTWNPGAEALFGYHADEIIGHSIFTLYPTGTNREYEETYSELRQGNSVRRDVVRQHKGGMLLHVNINISPMHAPDGRISGFSAIIRDISDRKQHEEHLRLVMRELSHRSKNLLAVIQAMARQTARSSSDLDEFERNYSQRLQALSASHDLLVNQNWHGAPLGDLLRSILSPFDDDFADRIELIGPSLFVTPTAAQNLALSIHELATNASKYGALSVPAGRVTVEWHMEKNGDGQERLALNWKEVDGPLVEAPKRRGFGHIVINRMVAQALDAEVDLEFAPEGVSWTLQMPAAVIVK
jgi:PAS domain S-box-containing protein